MKISKIVIFIWTMIGLLWLFIDKPYAVICFYLCIIIGYLSGIYAKLK